MTQIYEQSCCTACDFEVLLGYRSPVWLQSETEEERERKKSDVQDLQLANHGWLYQRCIALHVLETRGVGERVIRFKREEGVV